MYLLCTDPGQAAENLCNNVSGGIDRLTGIGERIWDDPLGCVARGAERVTDRALGLLDEITGRKHEAEVNVEEQTSVNVEVADAGVAVSAFPTGILDYQETTIGGRTWITVTVSESQAAAIDQWITDIGAPRGLIPGREDFSQTP